MITVIIPTYNRLWSLPKAIESCRQNSCATEIIVVDDGSNDGTWEWLQTQDNLIRLRQDNWGKPWAVNRALALAQGEYIRFLDSDDWLEPHANDRQLAIARREQADVVVAGYRSYNQQEECVGETVWHACDDFIAQQLGECDSSHYSSFLFRKEFLEDFCHRPDYAFRDDRLFILEVALAYPRVATCNFPALAHRHHHRPRLQIASPLQQVVTHWQQLQLYQKILSILEERGELTARRQAAAAKILWPLAHRIAYTHLEEGVAVAKWVFGLDPEFRPPEAGILGLLYRIFGFRAVQILLRCRRTIRQMLTMPMQFILCLKN